MDIQIDPENSPVHPQIQIVVTKVVPERGKSGVGGTDITVTTMNRGGGGQVSVGGGGRGGGGPNTAGLGIGNRRLPPLVIPGSLGVALNSGKIISVYYPIHEKLRSDP